MKTCHRSRYCRWRNPNTLTGNKGRVLVQSSCRAFGTLRSSIASRWLILITYTKVAEAGREEGKGVRVVLGTIESVLRAVARRHVCRVSRSTESGLGSWTKGGMRNVAGSIARVHAAHMREAPGTTNARRHAILRLWRRLSKSSTRAKGGGTGSIGSWTWSATNGSGAHAKLGRRTHWRREGGVDDNGST